MASFGVGAMLITMLTIFGAYFKFAWQGKSEVDVDKPGALGLDHGAKSVGIGRH